MKVFVFEHVCGGGMALDEVPESIMWQGFWMLRSVAEDFCSAGYEVLSVLRRTVKLGVVPERNLIRVGGPKGVHAAFDQQLSAADAALVIAPETDGALESWCCRVERSGKHSYSSSSKAVRLCGDKLALYGHFVRRGVPTPLTTLLSDWRAGSCAYVVKPRDGVGCEQTRLVRPDQAVTPLVDAAEWVAQAWVDGRALSASFLVGGGRARPLLVGEQLIRLDGTTGRLSYEGGRLPVDTGSAKRASSLAESALECIEGLNGFVGVDLILADDPARDVVIEVNPRVTLSYVGLRALCETSLVHALRAPRAPLTWRDGTVEFDHAGQLHTDR